MADYVVTMWWIPQCGRLCGAYHSVADYVVTMWWIPQCGRLCGIYHSVGHVILGRVVTLWCPMW